MTATAVHIPTWRIHLATLTNHIFGPDHTGADTDWPAQLRNAITDTPGRHRVDNADTQVLRLPIGAIANVPYQPIHDPILGDLLIGPKADAAIYREMEAGR